MKKKLLTALTAAVLSAGLSTTVAHADTVTLTILSPTKTTNPGKTLAYTATITAAATNAANEYLNGDAFTFAAPFALDDTPYFANFPLFLTPGQSVTAVLFDFTVPLTSALSTYTGSFTLLGGSTASSYNALSATGTPFAVTVTSAATTVTPEPSSLLLMGTGLLGTVGVYQRRLRSALHRSPVHTA